MKALLLLTSLLAASFGFGYFKFKKLSKELLEDIDQYRKEYWKEYQSFQKEYQNLQNILISKDIRIKDLKEQLNLSQRIK